MVVFRHFPRGPVDSGSFRFHEAAIEAERQGKFWEFHNAVLSEGARTMAEAERIAWRLGLDRSAFRMAMKRRVHKARVLSDLAAGKTMGLIGSPTVFVNGTRIDGVLTARAFLLREGAPRPER